MKPPPSPTSSSAAASRYDAVIVGSGLAGCSAAILLARAGARVALLERSPDPGAFKGVCSHYIQSSAIPTLRRLGLLGPMEEAGAQRSRLRVRTDWGWIVPPADDGVEKCINLRRRLLDPMIRAVAAATPGVELILGARVEELTRDGGRICGVRARRPTGGAPLALRARLVVGADGRGSRVAREAGLAGRVAANARFAYGAYFEGPAPPGAPDGLAWALDPDWGLAAPTDGGLTFYAALPTRHLLPEFRRDPAAALIAYIASLPEPPPIADSRMVGTPVGRIDISNVAHRPVAPGLALVGDAALATDPLWAMGCGWALRSGEWLADSLAPALLGAEPLDRGLGRYRRRHARTLDRRAAMIAAYGKGEAFGGPERLLISAAAGDERLARSFEAFATANIGMARLLAQTLPRATALGLRHRVSSRIGGPPGGLGGVDADETGAA
jgi:flavin-dependent dehydrogenase